MLRLVRLLWVSVLGSAVIAGGAYYLLRSGGAIHGYFGLDLSFAATPFYALAAAWMSSRLVTVIGHRSRWRLAGRALAWAGGVIAIYLAVEAAPRVGVELVVTDRFAETGKKLLPYLDAVGDTSLWVAAVIAVAGIGAIFAMPARQFAGRSAIALLRAVSWAAVGALLFAVGLALSDIASPAGIAGAVAMGACLGIASTHIAAFALRPGLPELFLAPVRWLEASRFRAANLGAVLALYAAALRPALYSTASYAPLLEWLAIALPAAYVIARTADLIRAPVTVGVTTPAWLEWRRHVQLSTPVPDRHLTQAAALRDAYVETGEFEILGVRMGSALAANSVPAAEISDVLRPLVQRPSAARSRNRRANQKELNLRRTALAGVDRAFDRAMRLGQLGREGTPPGWDKAIRGFMAEDDRLGLAVAMIAEGCRQGRAREVLATQFGHISQFRAPKPRWYDLPPARRRIRQAAIDARGRLAREVRAAVSPAPAAPASPAWESAQATASLAGTPAATISVPASPVPPAGATGPLATTSPNPTPPATIPGSPATVTARAAAAESTLGAPTTPTTPTRTDSL